MGVASGCGFKEIYRFPHTTYPYSSCICTFWQQHIYIYSEHSVSLCLLVHISKSLWCAKICEYSCTIAMQWVLYCNPYQCLWLRTVCMYVCTVHANRQHRNSMVVLVNVHLALLVERSTFCH